MATTAIHFVNGHTLYSGMSHQTLVKTVSEDNSPLILNCSRDKKLKDSFNSLIVINNVLFIEEIED